jgi:DNA-binding XRE family transcriptional regulator
MSDFEWTKKRETAALTLAKGHTQAAAADMAGVSEKTIYRWLNEPEFSQEVDRLSLMIETANRAHRLRIANRVIRQMVRDGETIPTTKDLLDWLKYAQGETDGVKLDLVNLLDVYRDANPE